MSAFRDLHAEAPLVEVLQQHPAAQAMARDLQTTLDLFSRALADSDELYYFEPGT